MYSEELKLHGIETARKLADWFCNVQTPMLEMLSGAGQVVHQVDENANTIAAPQWNCAFAIMGWLGAYKAFGQHRYLDCALGAARHLKSMQVFNPFMKKHYGAIREMTSQCTFCYPRDGLSAAWAFIELYRTTGDKEYLERAKLWGQWFLDYARDEQGWPLGAIQLEPPFKNSPFEDYTLGKYNNIRFSCQGGSLNFLYHLSLETNDKKWIGEPFIKIADYFINYIQQPDGFYRSIECETKKPPKDDPQKGLHRANDDLGSLGLLCAYKVTADKKYLASVEKFLNAVFAKQKDDGNFEDSVACIPIVLNVLFEAGNLIDIPAATQKSCERAIQTLLNSQETSAMNTKAYGGIIEDSQGKFRVVCARASGYAMIYLLKEFAGIKDFLRV